MSKFPFFIALRGRIAYVLFFSFVSICLLQAQKVVSKDQQAWMGVWNQTRLTDRWGIWFDAQYQRRGNFVDSLSEINVGVGATYYITDDVRGTAAYTYVNSYPEGSRKIIQPEKRPWQQLQWYTKYQKLHLKQWLRLEERFRRRVINGLELSDAYDFNFRVRYNFFLSAPLTKKRFEPGGWLFMANDEIHLNFGDQIVYNTFDQNRFFVGLGYQFTPLTYLQIGYLNIFQQLAAGNRYRRIDAIRIFYYHNLDFR